MRSATWALLLTEQLGATVSHLDEVTHCCNAVVEHRRVMQRCAPRTVSGAELTSPTDCEQVHEDVITAVARCGQMDWQSASSILHKELPLTTHAEQVQTPVEASVALRGEPTGVAVGWNADVVATAKRDLKPGDTLDGEGGYTVWGKLLPSRKSVQMGGVPLGLAHDVKVIRPVPQGQVVTWADVAMDTTTRAYQLRMALEALK